MQYEYDKYGNIKGCVINGEKEGEHIKYYDNGILYDKPHIFEVCNYENGKKNGCYKSYYFDGQIQTICYYIDDKQNGEFKLYYKNGNLKASCMCINDKIKGQYKHYYEDGSVYMIVDYN